MYAMSETLQAAARPDAVTLSVATSLQEVEALRSVWSSFAITDIDSDIDYFMTPFALFNEARVALAVAVGRAAIALALECEAVVPDVAALIE